MLRTKKYTSLIFMLLVSITANAQIKPNTSITPAAATQAVHAVPSAYANTVKVNFIRSWEPSIPYTNEADVISTSRTVSQVKQTTQYFDGLGRPLQTVARQVSPAQKDLVSMNVYDEFGRETHQYLPYVQITPNTNTNDGKFKLNPFGDQSYFMVRQYAGEQIFYSQTVFEVSPLNRPVKSMAQGNSWAGSNRGVSVSYEINDANEVRLWNIGTAIGAVPTTAGSYDASQLYRTVTTDEHGKRVAEYKDKEGHVVLKKVEITTGAGIASHTGWLCTYYVYDDFGQLRFVIPPLAVQQIISNNWLITNDVVTELCFIYGYNEKHLMSYKKVPGSGEVFMIYDYRDRLILVQDEMVRNWNNNYSSYNWIATIYDDLNRPIRTAIWSDGNATDWYSLQVLAWESEGPGIYNNGDDFLYASEILTETYYDNYSWATGIAGISSTLNNSFTTSQDYIGSFNTSPYYAQQVVVSNATRGMVTGSKVRILGTNNYLYSLSLYDDKGRAIQVQSTNHTGGTDIVTTQYDFSGKLLRTHQKHIRATGVAAISIATLLTYDHAGRVTKTEKRINNGYLKVINENSYNELGQLNTKKLGRKSGSTTEPLETLDYSYNIRGWLTGINKDYANNEDEYDDTRKFGMQLSYDYGFTQSQFNGNIAGIKWKSTGSDKQRAYGFAYDNANRLLKGDFTQNTDGWNTSAGVDYSMKMGDGINHSTAYDANGNIKAMWQKGLEITASNVIDNLSYTYYTNSNKLKAVNDAIIATTDNNRGDFNDKNTTLDDYEYDANGNLINDKNKSISSIVYNHLNLPSVITVNNTPSGGSGGSTITYTYDAAGNKLKKTTVDNSTTGKAITTVTDYVAGFVYETKTTSPAQATDYAITLQFFGHEEGRFRPYNPYSPTYWNADYMIKDHLGNVRMVLTDEQRTDNYYASFETNNYTYENSLFTNMSNIVDRSECFDDGDALVKVQEVGSANSTNPMVVGAGKLLKVMAGDHVNAEVLGWFSPNIKNNEDPANFTALDDLLLSLFSTGLSNTLGGVKADNILNISGGSTNLWNSIGDFLYNQNNYMEDQGAYLNWILLDEEQLKLVQTNSGFADFFMTYQTSNCNSGKTVLQMNGGDGIDIKQNGYLYIYVSNTNLQYPVYFDNLLIDHTRGSLTEETHYYPFGLTMSGISSKAATNAPANKLEYNGIEFENDLDLNVNDAFYRELDPQTGRWWEIDPKIEENMQNWSPYASNFDNPIKFSDPKGDCPTCKEIWKDIKSAAKDTWKSIKENTAAAYTNTVNFAREFNQFNPIANAAELITGKSSQSDFTKSKPRTQSFAEMVVNTIGTFGGEMFAMAGKTASVTKNAFAGLTSINDIGKMGETLTKEILEQQYKGANIMEQVGIKMDGASMTADFVVVKDGKVLGVFESKVNGSNLSNGQKLFFNDGDAGILTGKNAGALQGTKIDPSAVQKGVFRWDSKTAGVTVQ